MSIKKRFLSRLLDSLRDSTGYRELFDAIFDRLDNIKKRRFISVVNGDKSIPQAISMLDIYNTDAKSGYPTKELDFSGNDYLVWRPSFTYTVNGETKTSSISGCLMEIYGTDVFVGEEYAGRNDFYFMIDDGYVSEMNYVSERQIKIVVKDGNSYRKPTVEELGGCYITIDSNHGKEMNLINGFCSDKYTDEDGNVPYKTKLIPRGYGNTSVDRFAEECINRNASDVCVSLFWNGEAGETYRIIKKLAHVKKVGGELVVVNKPLIKTGDYVLLDYDGIKTVKLKLTKDKNTINEPTDDFHKTASAKLMIHDKTVSLKVSMGENVNPDDEIQRIASMLENEFSSISLRATITEDGSILLGLANNAPIKLVVDEGAEGNLYYCISMASGFGNLTLLGEDEFSVHYMVNGTVIDTIDLSVADTNADFGTSDFFTKLISYNPYVKGTIFSSDNNIVQLRSMNIYTNDDISIQEGEMYVYIPNSVNKDGETIAMEELGYDDDVLKDTFLFDWKKVNTFVEKDSIYDNWCGIVVPEDAIEEYDYVTTDGETLKFYCEKDGSDVYGIFNDITLKSPIGAIPDSSTTSIKYNALTWYNILNRYLCKTNASLRHFKNNDVYIASDGNDSLSVNYRYQSYVNLNPIGFYLTNHNDEYLYISIQDIPTIQNNIVNQEDYNNNYLFLVSERWGDVDYQTILLEIKRYMYYNETGTFSEILYLDYGSAIRVRDMFSKENIESTYKAIESTMNFASRYLCKDENKTYIKSPRFIVNPAKKYSSTYDFAIHDVNSRYLYNNNIKFLCNNGAIDTVTLNISSQTLYLYNCHHAIEIDGGNKLPEEFNNITAFTGGISYCHVRCTDDDGNTKYYRIQAAMTSDGQRLCFLKIELTNRETIGADNPVPYTSELKTAGMVDVIDILPCDGANWEASERLDSYSNTNGNDSNSNVYNISFDGTNFLYSDTFVIYNSSSTAFIDTGINIHYNSHPKVHVRYVLPKETTNTNQWIFGCDGVDWEYADDMRINSGIDDKQSPKVFGLIHNGSNNGNDYENVMYNGLRNGTDTFKTVDEIFTDKLKTWIKENVKATTAEGWDWLYQYQDIASPEYYSSTQWYDEQRTKFDNCYLRGVSVPSSGQYLNKIIYCMPYIAADGDKYSVYYLNGGQNVDYKTGSVKTGQVYRNLTLEKVMSFGYWKDYVLPALDRPFTTLCDTTGNQTIYMIYGRIVNDGFYYNERTLEYECEDISHLIHRESYNDAPHVQTSDYKSSPYLINTNEQETETDWRTPCSEDIRFNIDLNAVNKKMITSFNGSNLYIEDSTDILDGDDEGWADILTFNNKYLWNDTFSHMDSKVGFITSLKDGILKYTNKELSDFYKNFLPARCEFIDPEDIYTNPIGGDESTTDGGGVIPETTLIIYDGEYSYTPESDYILELEGGEV